mgnify:CR=1 FL=1
MIPKLAVLPVESQYEVLQEEINKKRIVYKLVDNGNHTRSQENKNEAVLKIFPFAKDQPEWVVKALMDYFNMKRTIDVIKFFNMGGELTGDDTTKEKHLYGHASHDTKVNGLEIQDLHI